MYYAESFSLATEGRGTYEITAQVQRVVLNSGIAALEVARFRQLGLRRNKRVQANN